MPTQICPSGPRCNLSIVGMDFSQSFIDAANALKEAGTMGYTIATEGDLTKPATATVDSAIDRQRTTFKQGLSAALMHGI